MLLLLLHTFLLPCHTFFFPLFLKILFFVAYNARYFLPCHTFFFSLSLNTFFSLPATHNIFLLCHQRQNDSICSYSLRKKFKDTQEWLPKILYFIRIKLYIYDKCIYSLSFHIIPFTRRTSGFNIKKTKRTKIVQQKKVLGYI